MSTDVLAVTVLPGPPAAPGHLILGVDEAGVLYEVAGDQPGGDVVHCVLAWDAVVERIAQSAGVVIEHGREPGPLLRGSRPPDCADDPWLTRVAARPDVGPARPALLLPAGERCPEPARGRPGDRGPAASAAGPAARPRRLARRSPFPARWPLVPRGLRGCGGGISGTAQRMVPDHPGGFSRPGSQVAGRPPAGRQAGRPPRPGPACPPAAGHSAAVAELDPGRGGRGRGSLRRRCRSAGPCRRDGRWQRWHSHRLQCGGGNDPAGERLGASWGGPGNTALR